MINEQYKKMLEGKSVIRQLSEFATARGKEIGYEKDCKKDSSVWRWINLCTFYFCCVHVVIM